MTWNHRWRGKMSEVPLVTVMEWSLQNWIYFLDMLQRWSSGGTSWSVMPEEHISSIYLSDDSLSKILCLGFNLQQCIQLRARSRSMMISPLVRFFFGLTQVELESILWRIIWYLLPYLDVRGNFTVWLLYKLYDMSWMVMMMLCWRGSSLSSLSLSSSLSSVVFFVDLTPDAGLA